MSTSNLYADLEIRILERQDAGYPVEITLDGGQEFPRGFLAADILPWTCTGNPRADGQRLFTALFGDAAARTAWDRACGQHPQRQVRLRLDTTAPELHALPWELLHDGQTFLAADAATPFSRYLPSDAPRGGLIAERPIRILAVISNPANLDKYNLAPLDVAAERQNLKAVFSDLPPALLYLDFLDTSVTLEHLERKLATGYHVLHFVGHGTFDQRRGQTVLYLQDAADNIQTISEDDLSAMLKRQAQRPTLVFLAACQSATRSTVNAFAGLAPKLVRAGVSAVIAMQDKVAITTTHKLASVFYEELARHGAVDRALNAARSLLLTGNSTDVDVPVLLMRLNNGCLFAESYSLKYKTLGQGADSLARPPKPPKTYVRRIGLEDTLRQALNSNIKIIVLCGIGGAGKSTLVSAVLHDTALTEICYWLSARESRYWEKLQEVPEIEKAYIILDNLDNPGDLDDFKTPSVLLGQLDKVPDSYTVIVTTRSQDIGRKLTNRFEGKFVKIDVMTQEEARNLLIERLQKQLDGPRIDINEALVCTINEITQRLGYHPLAIESYVAYTIALYEGDIPKQCETALQRLQQSGIRLDPTGGSFETQIYHLFDEFSWKICSSAEKRIFALCGLFNSGQVIGWALEKCLVDETHDVVRYLDNLCRLSLLYFVDSSNKEYRLHPLLLSFARQKLKEDYQQLAFDVQEHLVNLYYNEILESSNKWEQARNLYTVTVDALVALQDEDRFIQYCSNRSPELSAVGLQALFVLEGNGKLGFVQHIINRLTSSRDFAANRVALQYAYRTSSKYGEKVFLRLLLISDTFLGVEIARYAALKVTEVEDPGVFIRTFFEYAISPVVILRTKMRTLIIAIDTALQIASRTEDLLARQTLSLVAQNWPMSRLLYFMVKILPLFILRPFISAFVSTFELAARRIFWREFPNRKFSDVFIMTSTERINALKVIRLLDRHHWHIEPDDYEAIESIIRSRNPFPNYIAKMVLVIQGYDSFQDISPIFTSLFNFSLPSFWLDEVRGERVCEDKLVDQRQAVATITHLLRIGGDDPALLFFLEKLNDYIEPRGLSMAFEIALFHERMGETKRRANLVQVFEAILSQKDARSASIFLQCIEWFGYYYPIEALELLEGTSVWVESILFKSLARLLATLNLIFPDLIRPILSRIYHRGLISDRLQHEIVVFEQSPDLLGDYVMLSQTALVTRSLIGFPILRRLFIDGVELVLSSSSPGEYVTAILQLILERFEDSFFFSSIWEMDEIMD